MNNIIFPENNSSIIAGLLEKHGIKESSKDVADKMFSGKKPFGTIVAELAKKLGREEITIKDFISSLKEELGITQKAAESMANEINEKIIAFIEKSEPEQEIIIEKKGPPRKDGYRETVE